MNGNKLDYDEFMTKTIYDWTCKLSEEINRNRSTGKTQKIIDKTTVNNIVEIFQGDPTDAAHLLMLYIIRQSKRDEIKNPRLAQLLINDICQIYKSFSTNKKYLEEAIRKYLILFKWVYESSQGEKESSQGEKLGGKDFDEFVSNFIGGDSECRKIIK